MVLSKEKPKFRFNNGAIRPRVNTSYQKDIDRITSLIEYGYRCYKMNKDSGYEEIEFNTNSLRSNFNTVSGPLSVCFCLNDDFENALFYGLYEKGCPPRFWNWNP